MIQVLLIPFKLVGVAAVGVALGAGWKLGSHLADVAIGKKDVAKDKVAGFLESIKEHPWLGKIQAARESESEETAAPKQSPCS